MPPFIRSKPLQYLLLGTPIAAYFCFFFSYTVNYPFGDDYYFILDFFLDFFDSSATFSSRLAALFRPHNLGDYRPAFPKLIFLLDILLFGKVNFSRLQFYGNLNLLIITALLWRSFRAEANIKLIAFAPFVWLLFQLQYRPVTFWSTAAVVNLSSLTLNFWVLHILCKAEGRRILWSIPIILAGICTGGSAMLILPFGLIVMLYRKTGWRLIAPWLLCFAVFIALFFWHNPRPESNIHILLSQPQRILNFFFTNVGSLLGRKRLSPALSSASIFAARLAGIAAVFWLVYLLYRKYWERNLYLLTMLAFLLATCLLIAYGRINIGEELALGNRNRIYSLLAMGIIYLLAFEFAKEKQRSIIWAFFLILGISSSLLSLRMDLPEVKSFSHDQKTAAKANALNPEKGNMVAEEAFGKVIMKRTQERGYYTVPDKLKQGP
ncbi:MAG: hypothetical protein V4543_06675 [Bacteroidota bacterium]